MEKANRDALHVLGLERGKEGKHGLFIQRAKHPPLHIDTLGHGETSLARHQRLRFFEHQVILIEPGLVADLQHVTEAFRGDQRGDRPLALQNRVGRKRRAVNDQPHVAAIETGGFQRLRNACENAFSRRTWAWSRS